MPLLTIEEAANFLRVSKSWLYQHKEVPRHKLPGSSLLRFDQGELEAWAKSQKEAVDSSTQEVYHRALLYRVE